MPVIIPPEVILPPDDGREYSYFYIHRNALPSNHAKYSDDPDKIILIDDLLTYRNDPNTELYYLGLQAPNLFDDRLGFYRKIGSCLPCYTYNNIEGLIMKGYAPRLFGDSYKYSNNTGYEGGIMLIYHIFTDANNKLKIQFTSRSLLTSDYNPAQVSLNIEGRSWADVSSNLVDKEIHYLYVELCAGGGGSGGSTANEDSGGGGGGASICCVIDCTDVYIGVGSGGSWGDMPYHPDGGKGACSFIQHKNSARPNIICEGGGRSSFSEGGSGGYVYIDRTARLLSDYDINYQNDFIDLRSNTFLLCARNGGAGGAPGQAGGKVVGLEKLSLSSGHNTCYISYSGFDGGKLTQDSGGGGGASLFGKGGDPCKDADKSSTKDGRGYGGGGSGRPDAALTYRSGFSGGPGYINIIY